tara:strand:+ start:1532 stop:1726 length:195 start_codon:yes stop_codon:yes gene_type:complete
MDPKWLFRSLENRSFVIDRRSFLIVPDQLLLLAHSLDDNSGNPIGDVFWSHYKEEHFYAYYDVG